MFQRYWHANDQSFTQIRLRKWSWCGCNESDKDEFVRLCCSTKIAVTWFDCDYLFAISANLSPDLNAIVWLSWRTRWKRFHSKSIDVDIRRRLDIFERWIVSELCALWVAIVRLNQMKFRNSWSIRWWWNAASNIGRTIPIAYWKAKKRQTGRMRLVWALALQYLQIYENALTEADQTILYKLLRMSTSWQAAGG